MIRFGLGFLDMVEGWAIEGVSGAMNLLLARSGIYPINPLHLFFETLTTLQQKSTLTPQICIQNKIVKGKKYKKCLLKSLTNFIIYPQRTVNDDNASVNRSIYI